jgi:hypothetical protein
MITHVKLLLIAVGFGLVSAAAGAGEKAAPPPPAAEPEALAKATRLSGTADFRRAAASSFATLTLETALYKGDEVRTGRKSGAELKLADDSRLTLGEESTLVLREVRGKANADRTLLDLDEGAVGAAVEKLGERQRFEISTPVAVCGVRGTRFAILHKNPPGGPKGNNRGTSTVTVGVGGVNADCRNPLVGGQGGKDVGKGQRLTITWDGFGKLQDVKVPGFRDLMKTLPGWNPDPADPNLGKLEPAGPRGPIGGPEHGVGAYDRGGRGLSNGVEGAIFGRLGLGDLVGGSSGGGGGQDRNAGGRSEGQGGGGNAFDAAIFNADPVTPGLLRPGQPTELPPPPQRPTDVIN